MSPPPWGGSTPIRVHLLWLVIWGLDTALATPLDTGLDAALVTRASRYENRNRYQWGRSLLPPPGGAYHKMFMINMLG